MFAAHIQNEITHFYLEADIWIEGRISPGIKIEEAEYSRYWQAHEILMSSLKHWNYITLSFRNLKMVFIICCLHYFISYLFLKYFNFPYNHSIEIFSLHHFSLLKLLGKSIWNYVVKQFYTKLYIFAYLP